MKKMNPKIRHIQLRAVWGNDDAESSIKISLSKWHNIQNGAEYHKSTWSYYEGKRYHCEWSFANGLVTVEGDESEERLKDAPLDKLFVTMD